MLSKWWGIASIFVNFSVMRFLWNDPFCFPISNGFSAKGNVVEVFKHHKSSLINLFTKCTGKKYHVTKYLSNHLTQSYD